MHKAAVCCMVPEEVPATSIPTGYSAAAPLDRGRLLDKISRKSSANLQACGNLAVYICHIVEGQGKAMMARQMGIGEWSCHRQTFHM